MATSAPGHAAVPDRQGRLTLTMIDDISVQTASTSSTTPLTFVSRLASSDVQNQTKVDQVVEIGTNGIVGGVANLGSFSGKLSRYDTSSKLLGLITGKKWTSGTQTWNYYDLANADFDYVRLIADSTGAVFGASVSMSALLSGATFSAKSGGIATEEYDVMGKQLVYINGFPICKAYVIQSADVTNTKFNINSTFGADESPNPILPPAANQPPSSLYSSGRRSFLKVTRQLLGGAATINGTNYASGARVRYRENQPYKVVAAGLSTPGSQTVTPTILHADGTTSNYMGPDLVVGALLRVDPGNGAASESCVITAVTSTTITFTTTQVHPTTGIVIGIQPTTGQILYNPLNGTVRCGDTYVVGDVWRFLFASYGSDSTPTSIGTSSLDTTDVPGVPGRLVPFSISAYQVPRCSSADIKVSISRKEVQGLGEDEIQYGTAGVPKISYSLDVMATDNELLSALQTGSTAAGSGGDIYSADYTARYMLNNASNFLLTLKSPNSNSTTLKTYQGNLPVFTSFSESGNATSEITQKLSGDDFSGAITITAYA